MPSGSPAGSPKASAADAASATTIFEFGTKVLSGLLQNPEGNVFLSPMSIITCISMGVAGTTPESNVQKELLSLFNVPDEKTLIEGVVGAALKRINGASEGVEVSTANSVWSSAGVKKDYVQMLQQVFAAHAESRIQAPEINAWVEAATKGKIKNLLTDLPSNVTTVLVNAIYFHGKWAEAFKKTNTQEKAEFQNEDGSKSIIPLMSMPPKLHRYYYNQTSGVSAVALPYKGGNHAAILILPPAGIPLADFTASFGYSGIKEILTHLDEVKVGVKMPRFKAETNVELTQLFAGPEFGLKESLGATNQWARLTDAGNFGIDQIIHRAIVEVDEEGTTAAAATAMTLRSKSIGGPVELWFIADRPFLIMIYDRVLKVPLFIGGIRSPQAH